MSAKFSGKELEIMRLLMSGIPGGLYALEMIRMTEGRMKRGTIYTTLKRMDAKGYVHSVLAAMPAYEAGNPRRLYSPTSHGRELFNRTEAQL